MILGSTFALPFGSTVPPAPPAPFTPAKVDQVQRGVNRLALQFKTKVS